ncbi:MAG: hypothetical protein A2W31_18925 [Planctomycetes bacterium RBG_16_64_10]|nr:MAG: hypothetical protein A2W31_18925 [Planctomycetes bacterium RBG_16_64_10]
MTMTALQRPRLLMPWYPSIVLTCCLSTASADLVRPAPWLAGVAADSVYVCLEADDANSTIVEYGLTAAYGQQRTTEYSEPTAYGNRAHNVHLTGLQPNAQYHYRVAHGASVSADYTFWTAPEPGTPARWGFAADSRSQTAVHDAMAGLILAQNPRMMVYGGDLCTSGVSEFAYEYWSTEWFVPNQEALNATAPWVNATGNHEQWNELTRALTQAPAGDSPYFSFDYGDSHILILNTELPYSPGSPQWDFAANDLAAATAVWKVVAFHKSAYAAGGHGEEPGMVAMTQGLFEPHGVDLVLTGHNHFYQHNLVNDIHHMVLGSFGAPLYFPAVASYTILSEQTYCFGIIDTTPSDLTLTTYRDDGSVIEVLRLHQLLGDVNGDGAVNGLDVDPFVDVLLGGAPDRATEFRSDMNGDGTVNGIDVAPFEDAVVTGGGNLLGDVNRDGYIDGLDVARFVDVLLSGRMDVRADMNADGQVDGLDVDLFAAAVLEGGSRAVAEPMSALLLAAGGFGLLAFRPARAAVRRGCRA